MRQDIERIFRRVDQRLINLHVARAAIRQLIAQRFPEHRFPQGLAWSGRVDRLFVEYHAGLRTVTSLAAAVTDLLGGVDTRPVHYIDG